MYNYLISQPMVLVHYIVTCFIPYNLSADTDWKVYSTIFDYRAMLGILLILGLIYIALKASKDKETRLFSFGILWFFIGHLPTSSFITFAEILNDHRSFMPYLGLTIASVSGAKYLLDKYLAEEIRQKSVQGLIAVLLVLALGANAYGVRERNKVWKDGNSLWRDVAEKSPNNGRGLMKNSTDASTPYGILGMQERVNQLGGTLNFDTPPGGGFSVTVILPLSAKDKEKI